MKATEDPLMEDGDELEDELEEGPASDAEHEIKTFPGKFYDMRVPKGNIGNVVIAIWDQVRACPGDECNLYSRCPYFYGKDLETVRRKKEKGTLGLCRVEQKFLHHNLKPFWELLKKAPDEFVMQAIGMHLIPLYHDLVQLLMEKASLKRVTYSDSKGQLRVHPVYDQLEKTHKAIMQTMKSSGLHDLAKEVGYLKSGGLAPTRSVEDMLRVGNSEEYEQMSTGLK